MLFAVATLEALNVDSHSNKMVMSILGLILSADLVADEHRTRDGNILALTFERLVEIWHD